MMWDGWGMAGFGLMHVLWWALVIAGIVVLVRMAIRSPSGRDGEDRARSILRERFARGEIDQAEFDERMRKLMG